MFAVNAETEDVSVLADIALPSLTRLTVSLSRMSLYLIMLWTSRGRLQSLQQITLIFLYEESDDRLSLDPDDSMDDSQNIPGFGWSDVDGHLNAIYTLRKVEINGEYEDPLLRDPLEIEENRLLFRTLLPKLDAKGLLTYH